MYAKTYLNAIGPVPEKPQEWISAHAVIGADGASEVCGCMHPHLPPWAFMHPNVPSID